MLCQHKKTGDLTYPLSNPLRGERVGVRGAIYDVSEFMHG